MYVEWTQDISGEISNNTVGILTSKDKKDPGSPYKNVGKKIKNINLS